MYLKSNCTLSVDIKRGSCEEENVYRPSLFLSLFFLKWIGVLFLSLSLLFFECGVWNTFESAERANDKSTFRACSSNAVIRVCALHECIPPHTPTHLKLCRHLCDPAFKLEVFLTLALYLLIEMLLLSSGCVTICVVQKY